jgi:hypothetical protein
MVLPRDVVKVAVDPGKVLVRRQEREDRKGVGLRAVVVDRKVSVAPIRIACLIASTPMATIN